MDTYDVEPDWDSVWFSEAVAQFQSGRPSFACSSIRVSLFPTWFLMHAITSWASVQAVN